MSHVSRPRIPPPLWCLAFGLLMWALHRLLPAGRLFDATSRYLGWLIVLAGVAVSTAAALQFRRAGTTVNPLAPSNASLLVTTGLFSLSRNPMYLGLLVALAGWATVLGSASPWVALPFFVLVITRFQIVPEEHALAALFGADYSDYLARVGRWFGRGPG